MRFKTKVVSGKWLASGKFIADEIVGYTTSQGYKKAAKILGVDSVQIQMTELGHAWVPSRK